MPIAFRPRLPRRTRTRRSSGVVAPAVERTQPQIERISYEGLEWVHIEAPSALERAWLAEHYDFHALDLEDVMSRNQRPKIDEYPDYLFIVLHFPVFDKQVGRLNAGELDLFVGPDFIITIPNQPLKPVEYLFERCRTSEETRDQLFSKGPGYLLYQIVDQSFDYCFPMLRKIGNKLEQLEEEIFIGRSEEIVRDISNVKQEIISYRKIIKPERATLRVLERRIEGFLPEDLEDYFDDIVDAAERIWDLLDNYKEVVDGLEDTN